MPDEELPGVGVVWVVDNGERGDDQVANYPPVRLHQRTVQQPVDLRIVPIVRHVKSRIIESLLAGGVANADQSETPIRCKKNIFNKIMF